MKTTGSLGSVMKESMHIAYTFAKSYLHEKLNNDFLETHEVHVHAPEGATPKDGPSAGITITSGLISLALQKPVKQNIGMTGEISLRGKVLKIGGVKEKILAAKREGITELIFPKSNKEDIEELPKYITEGMTMHFVETYDEVFKILFESS
jgi:ATP-dependent Lon protease, bacterial type